MTPTEKRSILRNAAICPDGTLLVSRHTHDYVTHVDTTTGEMCVLDGGNDHVRIGGPVRLLTCYSDEPFSKLRKQVEWGTRGKGGGHPLRFVPICELDLDHIRAILDTQKTISDGMRTLLEEELHYRTAK